MHTSSLQECVLTDLVGQKKLLQQAAAQRADDEVAKSTKAEDEKRAKEAERIAEFDCAQKLRFDRGSGGQKRKSDDDRRDDLKAFWLPALTPDAPAAARDAAGDAKATTVCMGGGRPHNLACVARRRPC